MDSNQRDELSPVKRALLQVREMRAQLEQAQQARREPIAIVGMACRLPGGVDSLDAFWDMLSQGRDVISDVPVERWSSARWYDPDPDAPGKMYQRKGGFLAAVDRFDAAFFGITPREAERIDPQQRLLLELTWEALEHAAIAPNGLSGQAAGVFVGMSGGDYLQLQLQQGAAADIDAYLASGGSPAVAAGRIAYTLGLQGPAITLDTACSSSLSAVHLACQSLRDGECTLALAAGVSLMLMPELSVNFAKARMMAPDGRCKTFDAAADGYVRSEGCGVVVLKRLSDAQAAGDRILAVVRGSAINQDGRSSGLTVPNGPAQEAVMRAALSRANLRPADVDYVEAHGTGTALGDPIELRALGAVFAERSNAQPLVVASVKTNLGHLEAAAGITGLIKVVLAMGHGEIPAHLHLQQLTPHVPWSSLPLAVPTSSQPWPTREGRRVAGVSSFGFSGTNAHVTVASAPEPTAREFAEPARSLLSLSAKTPEALRALVTNTVAFFDAHPDANLAAICDTAGRGRAHFGHRLALVAESHIQARTALSAWLGGQPSQIKVGASVSAAPPEVAFLFTGQGSQYVGMGLSLYEQAPVFRASLDRCAELLQAHLPQPLLDVMFGRRALGHLLDQTQFTQPALFALEFALSELWRSWGVLPTIVLGHSLGEYVAACVAGMISLEDALRLVAERGRLMQALPPVGGMLAVFASEAQLAGWLEQPAGVLAVAALNGPEHTVLSGPSEAIAQLLTVLEREGIQARTLAASHAFHSSSMDPMLGAFETALGQAALREPELTVISNLTGRVATAESRQAQYWRRHAREPVRFEQSIQTAWALGARVFVEIGPSPVLLGMASRCVTGEAAWLPSLRRDREDSSELFDSLAELYTRGVSLDFAGIAGTLGTGKRRVVDFPSYPFQRERYWAPLAHAERSKTFLDASDGEAAWRRVTDAALGQSLSLPVDLAIESYPSKWRRLDELALEYMNAALAALGLFQTPEQWLTADELCARGGIVPVYRSLVPRWLRALEQTRRITQKGDTFGVTQPLLALSAAALEQLVRDSSQLFRDYPAVLEYMARCGTHLPEVLTGRESALETLFPGGSTALADQLYGTSPLSRYFNGMMRAVVDAAAKSAHPGRPLRILEIGAGTGGTTRELLPGLMPDRTEYVFSDVGSSFLSRAEERFGAFPYVRYQLFDVEKPPSEQGLAAHSFDLILASNVLHATVDLHQTLANVAWLLAPSGTLAMYEATRHPRWFDVTTGLISGWQRFQDDLRTDVPLVTPEVWERALRGAGFVDVRAFPSADSPTHVLGQHVIVSRGPLDAIAGERPNQPLDARVRTNSTGLDEAAPDSGVRAELAALPEQNRRERLVELVRDQVVRVLRLDPARPPERAQRLMDLGVDSLMAVEFRNLLTTRLALDKKLPATLIFDHPTIAAIADYLLETSLRPADTAPTADAAPAQAAFVTQGPLAPSPTAAELEALDDAEVEALLNQRLERM